MIGLPVADPEEGPFRKLNCPTIALNTLNLLGGARCKFKTNLKKQIAGWQSKKLITKLWIRPWINTGKFNTVVIQFEDSK